MLVDGSELDVAESERSRCYATCHTWAVERTSRRLSPVWIGRWFWWRVLVTGFPGTEAVHAHQIQDDRVVHDAIDGRHGRHRIFENAVPVRKDEVCRDGHAAPFVPLGQE